MKTRALPILALAALALAGCASGNDAASSDTTAPQTIGAPTESPDVYSTSTPFTLDDTLEFANGVGAKGQMTHADAGPQELAQLSSLIGEDGGTWFKVHVDNRNGTEPIRSFAPEMFDKDGNKYTLETDHDLANRVYMELDVDDPQHEKAEAADRDTSNDVEVGEAADLYFYSSKPIPHDLERGTIDVGWEPTVPLTPAK